MTNTSYIKKEEELLKDKVTVLFDLFIKKPEIIEALDLLDKLPRNLIYHNKSHTLDVIKETILFALADNAGMNILEQQVIAAAWHDIGYLERYENNEPIAVKLFEKSEAYRKLSDENREDVINSILDTQPIIIDGSPKLLQTRSTSGYLLDADVSNFGRGDFMKKRMEVVEELNLDLTNLETKKKFLKFALDLIKNHEWKTDSARRLRQDGKEYNIKLLEEEFAKLI